jgi:lipase maturation factor 1
MFRERHLLVRWIFLRAIGLISAIAFISIGAQIEGLIGERGILPVTPWLESAKEAAGGTYWIDFPTVFWLGSSDRALMFGWIAGALASLLLVAGIAQRWMLLLCWLLYLSICTVGRTFLAFQWDILVTEVVFTSILIAPRTIKWGLAHEDPPHASALLSLRLLLFKLMFSSGVVKLTSGDPTWRSLTALEYHYETQPLPTWIGWWAHQLPPSIQHASVVFTFAVQLFAPFLIFAPRKLRFAGCVALVVHQSLIALTGNYCFFNLIALALCVLCIDDAFLLSLTPLALRDRMVRVLERAGSSAPAHAPLRHPRAIARIALTSMLVLLNALQLARTVGALSSSGRDLLALAAPFRTVNGYGLFAVMTTTRNEIILEGSNDGVTWKPYALPYQPGELHRAPSFVAPHQPRLDWQMWFAALGSARQSPWFGAFVKRVLEGAPEVLALLEHNPFPEHPPQMIRAELYRYHFTNREERAATGAWWKRERAGAFLGPMSLPH